MKSIGYINDLLQATIEDLIKADKSKEIHDLQVEIKLLHEILED